MFEDLASRFRVTLSTRAVGSPLPDETVQTILARPANEGRGPTNEIEGDTPLMPHATRTRPDILVSRGLVHEFRTRPQDPRRCYHLGRMDAV